MPTDKQRRIIEAARATLSDPTKEQRRILDYHPPTEEQRQILEAARATLKRYSEPAPPPVEPMRYKTHTTPMPPQPEAQAPVDWAAYVEEKIAQEREFTIAVVGEALGQALAKAKADYKKAHQTGNAELNLEITKLKCVCDELRIALGAERRGTILELPALPRRSDLN